MRRRTTDRWRREPGKGFSHWVGITPELKGFSIWHRRPTGARGNFRVAYIRHPGGTLGPFADATKAKEHAELMCRLRELTEEDQRRIARFEQVDQHLLAAGFEIWPTGGGCTAWQYTLPDDRYVWITDIGGTGLGFVNDEPYILGFYGTDGEQITYSEHASLAETLRAFETLRRVAL